LTEQEKKEIDHLISGLLPATYEDFARAILRIRTKQMEVVPFILKPFQRDLIGKLTGRDLLVKPRQIGASSFAVGLGFKDNTTKTSSTLTISDTYANTKTLRLIYNLFYDEWPKETYRRPIREKDSETLVTYPELHSSSTIITAGSKTGGHGATYSYIHGSEVAHWVNPKTVFARAIQGLIPGGRIMLESTTNGAQGLFYELCKGAMDGENEWAFHFYAWWWEPDYRIPLDDNEEIRYTEEELKTIALAAEDGFVLSPEQIKWRRNKKQELKELFLQEYPEDPHTAFITTGGGVFDLDKIKFLSHLPEPVEGHIYAAGIDWGQDNDYTSLSIGDRTANQEVLLLRWRKDTWKTMRGYIMAALIRFKVMIVRPEKNSMGSSQIEELWYAMEAAIAEGDLPADCELLPFTMGGHNKHELVTFFRTGLEDYGYALLDDPIGKRELRSFKSRRTSTGVYSYAAAEGEHDDTIIARMLAYAGMMSIE
jgi:hypothetical protein